MKVAIVEPLQLPEEVVMQRFGTLNCEVKMFENKPKDQNEVVERTGDAEIMVVVNYPVRAEALESLENLKMIAVSFTGYDHIDIEKCRELGITVCNVPEYSTNSVAELVFGLVIAAKRKLIECDDAVRSGKDSSSLLGSELYGKTLGVIGTGKIGQKVCEIALAFGMNVIAYSRTRKEELVKKGIRYVDLETLLRMSDIVTVHVPLTKETEGMIGGRELEMMKDGAIIVNTARGKIIDTAALAEKLESGRILACLDVFDIEPPLPENHPLRNAKNAVLTPHVGYYTEEALIKRLEVTVENIRAFINGSPKNVVS